MALTRDEINLLLTINANAAGNTLQDLKKQARDLRRAMERVPVDSSDFNDLKKKLDEVSGKMKEVNGQVKKVDDGLKIVNNTSGGFSKTLSGLGSALAGLGIMAIIGQLFQWGKQLFSLSAEAEALQRKMKTVFGEAESIVKAFAETNANAIGLSRKQFQGLATDIGDLLVPMGFTKDQAAQLSAEIVTQAGVLSQWSKGKVSTKDASEILNKALLGERDALNSLGIDIKDATIQQELKRKGLEKLTGDELRQAEALITLEQITKQSAAANEDFAKSQDSLTARQARAQAQMAEIIDKISEAFIPVFAQAAESIAPVVEWLFQFGSQLAQTWQKAENFRAIVSGVFSAIGTRIKMTLEGLGSLAEGFMLLFEGEFMAAGAKFMSGFNNLLNPAEAGRQIAGSFYDGFQSVKNPKPEVMSAEDAKKNGTDIKHAYNEGFDQLYADLKAKGKKSAEDIEKENKKALENRLKAAEITYLKEELALEASLTDRKITQAKFDDEMLVIRIQRLNQELEAYKAFGKEQTKEALALRKELILIERGQRVTPIAPVATLGPTGIALPQSDGVAAAGQSAQLQGNLSIAGEQAALAEKFSRLVIMESEYEAERARLRVEAIDNTLAILREKGLMETDIYRQTLDEKFKAEEDYNKKSEDLEQRSAEQRAAIEERRMGITQDAIELGIQLLSQDENARKKHGAVIKALEVANATVSYFAELQSIWRWANANALNGIIPGWALIEGGAKAGLATARYGLAIGQIKKQFAEGGYTGDGMDYVDSTGHRVAGVVHAKEYVVPAWQVFSPEFGPVVSYLERGRLRGYADGGYVAPDTTPLAGVPGAAGGLSGLGAMSVEGLRNDFRAMAGQLQAWQGRVRVAYTDIEDAGSTLGTIRADAEI